MVGGWIVVFGGSDNGGCAEVGASFGGDVDDDDVDLDLGCD